MTTYTRRYCKKKFNNLNIIFKCFFGEQNLLVDYTKMYLQKL